MSSRYERAAAAIDAANAGDPVTLAVAGETGPRAQLEGRLAAAWAGRLRPDAGELLLLAARGHHLRRWEVPRATYPAGRTGYLRWRTDLKEFHADALAAILKDEGYSEDEVARVREIVRKRGAARDPDAQSLEDAACLVFLEAEFAPFAARTDRDRMVEILRKTWRKMSPAARDAALALAFDPADRDLVEEALAK